MERKFAVKCEDCGHEHDKPVTQCAECESTNLRKPDFKQKKYAQSLLFDRYVNSSEQLFIDVLKELEDDLNIMDDAYIILVKEYYVDGNSNIRLQRIKEMYRGDPATMHIYSDEEGDRGTMGFTCLHHRDFKSEDEHLSLPNNLKVWSFLKKISEDKNLFNKPVVDVKVQVWDKNEENVSLVDYKDSKTYAYRFGNAK